MAGKNINVEMYNHVVTAGQLQDHSLHVTAGLQSANSGQYLRQSGSEHMACQLILTPAHTQCTCRQRDGKRFTQNIALVL